MSMFPSLEPNGRSWDLGEFPLALVPVRGSSPRRFLQGTAVTGQTLTLRFDRRSDAEVQLLRDHYSAQAGTVLAFLLPQIVWSGHSSATFGMPVDGYFRYFDVLQENTDSDGWITVSVPLLAINDPGIA